MEMKYRMAIESAIGNSSFLLSSLSNIILRHSFSEESFSTLSRSSLSSILPPECASVRKKKKKRDGQNDKNSGRISLGYIWKYIQTSLHEFCISASIQNEILSLIHVCRISFGFFQLSLMIKKKRKTTTLTSHFAAMTSMTQTVVWTKQSITSISRHCFTCSFCNTHEIFPFAISS